MANTKHKFSLRLLIDEEKNRVVLAEASKDFVDVLCSLLTLPMGTIVRLLEKHQSPQSSIVGCFHNLYKSVSEMNGDNFKTQDCKKLLTFPRNLKASHCRKLKLNVDDSEATKFFVCPNFKNTNPCCKVYSNINNSRCGCGSARTYEFRLEEGDQADVCLGNKADGDGVFISCRTSFIITDDLKVALNSLGLVLNVLNGLGYAGFELVWELSIDDVSMGCVGNLCRSVKDLSFEKLKEDVVSTCVLPDYYNIKAQLLDIIIQEGAECLVDNYYGSCKFARNITKDVLSDYEKIVKLTPMNPKDYGGVGFVKGETNFIVSDDLFITPLNSSSTISLLSKLQMNISDIDEQVINISKSEAVGLLRASLITSNALTNGLSSFLSMMKQEDSTTPSSNILKSD